MAEEIKQIFNGMNLKKMVEMETLCDSISIESSFEDSENSISSSISSSSDLAEDASSPTSTSTASSSSSSSSNGPLYGLHEIMAELPIKRGLSKHYQGKSQSFTSLASVKSLEDLPKRVVPFRFKMKSCKSYGWGLDAHNNKSSYSPKATISKKGSRNCFMSSLGKGSISSLVISE